MKHYLLTAICIVAGILTACHDDKDDLMPGTESSWTVRVEGGSSVNGDGQVQFPRLASFERLSVSIDGYDAELNGAVLVSTDADWLTLGTDTMATDGFITLTTTGNNEGRQRTALIVFTSATDPTLRAMLSVTQLSDADQDTNAGDARSVLYVGYGYDIFVALDNPMAARTKQPIIDIETLKYNCLIYNFEPVHDSKLSRTDINYYAAQTISELATELTNAGCNSDVEIAGCLQNCQRVADAASAVTLNEQNLGYGVMTKTVAARVLDRAALQFLRKYDDEQGNNSNRLALNYNLRQAFNEIRRLSGEKREKKLEAVLQEYGTHIIVQADLGGKLDYAFTMQKTECFNLTEQAKQEMQYTIGQLANSDRNYNSHRVSSEKRATGAIQIWGGSEATRKLLKDDISKLDQEGRIPPEHMQQWIASIQASDRMEATEDMDVIHFELMPLWDLVPSDLRQDFLNATLQLSQRSDYQLPAQFLNLDIYELKTNKNDLFYIDDNEEGSLCRLLYFEDMPVLEVCSEYVPKIRTDKRITVAYPIYKQHIRMNQGLFLGDGIHQPAFVGFSGQNCYVNPIDTLPAGYSIKTFYYVNGNLMLKSPSKNVGSGKQRRVADDVLQLYSSDEYGGVTHRHPIVKIGSAFWTRKDIDHQMYFSETSGGQSMDYIQNGVLFAYFQGEPNEEFQSYNGWTFGYKPNTFFEGKPNMSWFLPTPTQVRELYAYLGFNPKALFRGQQSGFDAAFNGYYGWSNIQNSNKKFPGGQREVRAKGQVNVISSNNSNSLNDACLMVLLPDYSLQLYDDNSNRNALRYEWRNNFYPVRPVRGYMFEYPRYSDFTKNTR